MEKGVFETIFKRMAGVVFVLLLVLIGSSLIYYFMGHGNDSFLDCLYMTFITITTIGYGEVATISASPAGRILTMLVALAGIGTMTYAFSMVTALIVEGNLTHSFRRRKMEKKIEQTEHHYIVCGVSRVGMHIINELAATRRPYVVIEQQKERIDELLEQWPDTLYLEGDPTDNCTLEKAGIERASGLFATESEDHLNLVICLSASHLNASLRIVSHAREAKNMDKMKRAGATSVISSEKIGGLRMASEMARPAVVSFLDVMLRDKEKGLRIEEVSVPDWLAGKTLRELNLKRYRELLLLAVREGERWEYNPEDSLCVTGSSVLVFMGTPEARIQLEGELKD
ncbi:potassium channel protein [Pontiellaceae bacterium B1224]|nr:potassium channel protein [Pontiellaceae bacterium B1224]